MVYGTFDDSRMPLRLGSVLRVPSYAYGAWGIRGDDAELRKLSDEAYRVEWESGSPMQMQYVTDATARAGYGDFPQMLRNASANAIRGIVSGKKGKIKILDVGAGKSTVTIFDGIGKNDKNRVAIYMLEPSAERLENAVAELNKRGLKSGRDYFAINGTDMEIPQKFVPSTMDIVSYVATLHHHAFLDTPLSYVYDITKPNGHLVVADWHNPMWEHPNRVYNFLRKLDWDTKKSDLRNFVQAYPKAAEEAPLLEGAELVAYEMIQRFWKGWADARADAVRTGKFNPNDDIFMLEAHRPAEKQNEEIFKSGFKLYVPGIGETNPFYLMGYESSLLARSIFQKC